MRTLFGKMITGNLSIVARAEDMLISIVVYQIMYPNYVVADTRNYLFNLLVNRMPNKFYTNISIVIIAVLLLSGCSKEGHVDFDIKDQHLEQHPAGSWLAAFDIDYSQGPLSIKKQILEKLHKQGKLIDKYRREENANVISSFIWNYKDSTIKEEYYKGGIWGGPKIIPYQEYYAGELAVWITIEFKEGVPYSKVIPNHYKQINATRKYEHTATIKFPKDNARLFLFGYGSICNRISLF
jgi:hypothetical protein